MFKNVRMTNLLENDVGKPLFRDISADDTDPEVTEMESFCVQCRQDGTTRLLLTKIPFYKEVVVISFSCPHCNWENNELQPAGKIQENGTKFVLQVKSIKDLSREVVKTEWATVIIPEIDFEIPPRTQVGDISTIEGIIQRAVRGLSERLLSMKNEDSDETFSKISSFITKLKDLCEVKDPFTFILDDPSGNSFLENYFAPLKDDFLSVNHYQRTSDQDIFLGIFMDDTSDIPTGIVNEEVMSFSTNCPNCNAPSQTNMKVAQIPHFKECVLMATNCEACGHKTNEVKGGGGIEPLGTTLKLMIQNERDLSRDVLKSETCEIQIPELEFEVGSGALGGRFTTVEGLLQAIKHQLAENNPMIQGDSADEELKSNMDKFLHKIDEILKGKTTVELILDDPCGNSYIQNLKAPDPDPQLIITKYKRTFEQNEELGLNDMKTENYK